MYYYFISLDSTRFESVLMILEVIINGTLMHSWRVELYVSVKRTVKM